MPDFGSATFSQTDANNSTGTMPSWLGTAAPSTLDDAGRALQGAVTRQWNWTNYTVTAGGTADAKTLTYSVTPQAYYNGQGFRFIANTTNTAAVTLNVNSIGAKAVRKIAAGSYVPLSAGDMVAGTYVEVSYNLANDCFVWDNQIPFFSDGSGNIGLGTSSPSSDFDISKTKSSGNVQLLVRNNDSGAASAAYGFFYQGSVQMAIGSFGNAIGIMGTSSNHPVILTTNGVERARIDTSGNVGIGTTAPAYDLEITKTKSGANTELFVRNTDTGVTSAAYAHVYQGAVQAFFGSFGNQIGVVGTSSSHPIVFQTGASERMRLDHSSGNVLVGYTSSNGSFRLQVNSQIFATSSTIATSDGRYKENVTPISGALDIVSALNPVQFTWKPHPVHNFDDSGPTVGFIAQEVETALASRPYLNSIIKKNNCVIQPEQRDESGNVTQERVTEEFYGIAEGNLIAILTKAIQEQQTQIEALTARIEALENAA